MTFRRLAPNTHPAESLGAARSRALALYREWLREVWRLGSTTACNACVCVRRCRG